MLNDSWMMLVDILNIPGGFPESRKEKERHLINLDVPLLHKFLQVPRKSPFN